MLIGVVDQSFTDASVPHENQLITSFFSTRISKGEKYTTMFIEGVWMWYAFYEAFSVHFIAFLARL